MVKKKKPTKKELYNQLKEKDEAIQFLIKTIADKDQQIIKLLVELGEYYEDEIKRDKENNL